MEEIFCMEWNMEEVCRYGMEKKLSVWNMEKSSSISFQYMPG